MSLKSFSWILFGALILGATLPAADDTVPPSAPGASLVETHRITTPVVGASLAPLIWRGGALLLLERSSATPVIHAFDRDGGMLSRVPFSIPEASGVKVFAFTRGSDGSLAVVGSGYTADRGTTFLALIAPDGQRQQIIQLKPFAPFEVVVAPDGTFWVLGRELVDGREVNPNHHVLRRYSPSGGELDGYLPRSTLPPGDHPAPGSFLVSSGDRIGWYSNRGRLYVELSLDGRVLTRVEGVPLEEGVNGVGLCDDGSVFVGVTRARVKSDWTTEIYRLDRASASWKVVPQSGDPATAQAGYLCGCDGNDLVTRRQPYVKFFGRLTAK